MQNQLYDPTPFVRQNLSIFLQEGWTGPVSISFKGFHRRMFHSGKRPGGLLEIRYLDCNRAASCTRVWVKLLSRGKQPYQPLRDIYCHLKELGLHYRMPEPFAYDSEGDALFNSYFSGQSLARRTFLDLISPRPCDVRALSTRFLRIGHWLGLYHTAMHIDRHIDLAEIIDELREALDRNNYFLPHQKATILTQLERARKAIGPTRQLWLTRPHNDFSLRNILLTKPDDFVVVDWDATLHESFPQVAPAWEDVIVFFLNTQSLLRFHPLVSCRRVHYLTESFLTGYFGALPMDVARDGQRVLLLWVFSLRCFLGLSRDRPLYLIYNTRLSSRYIRLLRRALIDGKVAVISPDGKAPL